MRKKRWSILTAFYSFWFCCTYFFCSSSAFWSRSRVYLLNFLRASPVSFFCWTFILTIMANTVYLNRFLLNHRWTHFTAFNILARCAISALLFFWTKSFASFATSMNFPPFLPLVAFVARCICITASTSFRNFQRLYQLWTSLTAFSNFTFYESTLFYWRDHSSTLFWTKNPWGTFLFLVGLIVPFLSLI